MRTGLLNAAVDSIDRLLKALVLELGADVIVKAPGVDGL